MSGMAKLALTACARSHNGLAVGQVGGNGPKRDRQRIEVPTREQVAS
jgi:hypothetical protein